MFSRLRTAWTLNLKRSKCVLFREQVAYLEDIISAKGFATDPQKIQKVAGWPIPQSVFGAHQFVGLVSYYQCFIKDFTSVAKPLHVLTKKYILAWMRQSMEVCRELTWKSPEIYFVTIALQCEIIQVCFLTCFFIILLKPLPVNVLWSFIFSHQFILIKSVQVSLVPDCSTRVSVWTNTCAPFRFLNRKHLTKPGQGKTHTELKKCNKDSFGLSNVTCSMPRSDANTAITGCPVHVWLVLSPQQQGLLIETCASSYCVFAWCACVGVSKRKCTEQGKWI